MKINTVLLAITSVSAKFSIDICSTPKQGQDKGVLTCPNGRQINIISAEYGRRKEDQETCCRKDTKKPCYPTLPGEGACVVDALPLVQKCQDQPECTLQTVSKYFREHNVGNCWAPNFGVQKFLNVQYDCVPAPASTTTMTTTTTTEMKESCVEVMIAAFNFYKGLQLETESDKSHNGKFKLISRIDLFKSNMLKWGNKLTKHGCNCNQLIAANIHSATSISKYEIVNELLNDMADNFACASRTKNMRNGVNRKVAHAKQILTGVSPNGLKIKKRYENWQTFLL